jgi:uncharacterized protein (TIGR03790 family)
MARKLTAALAILVLLAAASCGGHGGSFTTQVAQDPAPHALLARALPSLNNLPYPTAASRRVSAVSYQLLDNLPLAQSAAGVTLIPGGLLLDPAATPEGFAWAIFALPGFPSDHSIYPTDFSVGQDAGCWIAYSDYSQGHWGFYQATGDGGQTYADGTQLISPAGVHYVAVIAAGKLPAAATTVTSLQVTTNAELPETPIAVLNVPVKVAQSIPADFSALGSSPGAGAFTSITFCWGDGTADDTVTDPTQVVQHTYATAGTKTVLLTVTTNQLLSDTDEKDIAAIPAMRDLLLVYNADIPEDLDLANYYASPITGRSVDPAYILGIHPVPLDDHEMITRQSYNDTIRDQIKAFIDASTFKNSLKYILLCKGVPYRIPGADQWTYTKSTYSSVDSELCLLYSDGTYNYESFVWNGGGFCSWDTVGFYQKGDGDFTPHTFSVSDKDGKVFTLDYLVGRLTAYTYDEVKAMMDRAINADTTGSGSIIFDSSTALYNGVDPPSPQNNWDTMVDPVWPWTTDAAKKSGYELLHDAGYAVYADVTTRVLTGAAADGITVPIDKVIGYCGWGTDHAGDSYPNAGNYILKDLQFTYLPGACWIGYESFNGRTFNTDTPSDPSHTGQGLIADFFHMGGTVAICNAWEPFTIGVGDERWIFNRYIICGDRWIEAAYKGLRTLSWQEVVVGDPLCQVK